MPRHEVRATACGNPAVLYLVFSVTMALLFAACGSLNRGVADRPARVTLVLGVAPSVAKAGATVRLGGYGFGGDPAAIAVTFGGKLALVQSLTETEIQVQVPLDGDGALAVTLAGKHVEVRADFNYIAETLAVAGISPAEGPIGTEVDITGEGFGEQVEWLSVSFGGVEAAVLECAGSELRTAVPVGAVTGLVTVTRGEQQAVSTDVFTVTSPVQPPEPPVVASFTPEAVFPLDEVRITGAHFGTDFATLQVYVGGKAARVVGLSDGLLAIQPVPGTAGGPVRVVTVAGEAASAAALAIKPYPDYFGRIEPVTTTTIGPGGLLEAQLVFTPGLAGIGVPVVDQRPLKQLAFVESHFRNPLYQIPINADGEYYLGLPNMLRAEDKPAEAGADEKVWVTAYFAQPLTVTTEGMHPPQTTGLVPFEIYGDHVGMGDAYVALPGADYSSPIAILADGELIEFYDGQATQEQQQEYQVQGGLPVMFNSPDELFTLGEHSLSVITAAGVTTTAAGYRVISIESVDVQVDGISPPTARAGDLVTLTGKNLFWEGAGHAGLVPGSVRVNGIRMPVVPAGYVPPNAAFNEMQFLLTADAVSGEVVVDIVADQYGDPDYLRTIETGLTLSVDREYLDGFERYYVAKDSVDFGAYADLQTNRYNGLTDSGELYVAYREMVSYGEVYERLGYFTSAGYTDLGRIDRGPIVFTGFTAGAGPGISDNFVTILPDNTPYVMYYGFDIRDKPHPVEYWDLRLTAIKESGVEVYPHFLHNSEISGETNGPQIGITGGFDELGHYWGFKYQDLIKWDGGGWEIVGSSIPEKWHSDPVEGDIKLFAQGPIFAESDGHLKLWNSIFTIKHKYLAFYFIERQPDGAWEFTQLLGQDEYPTAWTFDRLGRGRVFTNDAEKLYIRREENGFIREDWAEIPIPTGAAWPAPDYYLGQAASSLSLEVVYDHLNRPIGTFGQKLDSTWEHAIESNSGPYVVSYILHGDTSAEIQFEPVGVYVYAEEPWNSNLQMLGQVIDTVISGPVELGPAGSRFVVTGTHIEYELVITEQRIEYDPEDMTINLHGKGVYVYSRDL